MPSSEGPGECLCNFQFEIRPGGGFNNNNNAGLSGSSLKIGVITTSLEAAVIFLVSQDPTSDGELVFFQCVSFFCRVEAGVVANSSANVVLE